MRIVDEGFEGTGYEESWAETVSGGKGGRTFFASEASGDNFVDSFLYEGWVEGLRIPTLASGKVYLQIG